MHPARLDFLAYRHAQRRAVVSKDIRVDGTTLTLECGHKSEVAPHFDVRGTKDCGCSECGRAYVKTAAQYAKEFSQ